MRLCLLVGFFAAGFSLLGQTAVPTPNTVTATVSTFRSASAGTATFQVQILDASLNASVDSAIALGASSGAAAANLAGVSVSISQGLIVSRYDFNVVVPASEYGATRDKLIAAQRIAAGLASTERGDWVDGDEFFAQLAAEEAELRKQGYAAIRAGYLNHPDSADLADDWANADEWKA